MLRTVSSRLDLRVHQPAVLALLVAVADGAQDTQDELSLTVDGRPVQARELRGPHGARVHRVEAPEGLMTVQYRAVVRGEDEQPPTDELDLLTYLRPSRYVPSDALGGLAAAELGGLSGAGLLAGAGRWVADHLAYVTGSSGPTDTASDVILSGRGVCRDFAHAAVALLRALDVPARLVSVYAPGLSPMDFHAVAEAHVEGAWHLLDATHLAPRRSMVRIATGRDAADTAFLSTYGGRVDLLGQEIVATVDGDLPVEDRSRLVRLA